MLSSLLEVIPLLSLSAQQETIAAADKLVIIKHLILRHWLVWVEVKYYRLGWTSTYRWWRGIWILEMAFRNVTLLTLKFSRMRLPKILQICTTLLSQQWQYHQQNAQMQLCYWNIHFWTIKTSYQSEKLYILSLFYDVPWQLLVVLDGVRGGWRYTSKCVELGGDYDTITNDYDWMDIPHALNWRTKSYPPHHHRHLRTKDSNSGIQTWIFRVVLSCKVNQNNGDKIAPNRGV